MLTRRRLLILGAATTAAAIAPRPFLASEPHHLTGKIHSAVRSALAYLIDRQHEDGSWRSQIYGPFKDGPSLTSLIAATLASLQHRADCHAAWSSATKYLAALAPHESTSAPQAELTYPAYTAAGAILAMASHSEFNSARHSWLHYLRYLQLTEQHGWQPSDISFGGWSYAPTGLQPINGIPATPLAVPNLSATTFALNALRSAGIQTSDPAIQKTQTFIERCQNWSDNPTRSSPRFNDGGFHFLLDDPQRNKAGETGKDATGKTRYASYGSATADGLHALIACGLPPDHPRRIAAQNWLRNNFSATQHPGNYSPAREHLRPTLYYYYCYSASRALSFDHGSAGKLATLAANLISLQRHDGSWSNPALDVREDDPLVATPLAIQALLACSEANS